MGINNITVSKPILSPDHRYWVNGVNIPGFTEIKNAMGIKAPGAAYYTEDGREEGSIISEWCHFLAQGKEPSEPPDSRIAGRVEGFRKFLSESGFVFVGGEQPLYDPILRFCGTPDLWGHLGAFSVIIDIKRGAKEKWHPLQTSAYKILLGANGFVSQKRYSLYLVDGDYRLPPHEDRADEERWKTLVAAYYAVGFYK